MVPSGQGIAFKSWTCSGGLSCSGTSNPTTVTFNGPGSITASFTYPATFRQVGLPPGAIWGVTVGGTRYTSSSQSVTVSGLLGTVRYSYDSSVPAPSVRVGVGGSYTCVSRCSGSVTGATTVTATYQPQLVVTILSPPSPANGQTVTGRVVVFSVHVTGLGGKSIPGATVTIYVNGVAVPGCSGTTDSKGSFSCKLPLPIPRPGGRGQASWYATAYKSGYAPGTSPTWTFKYL